VSEIYKHGAQKFRRNPADPNRWQSASAGGDDGWCPLVASGPAVAILNDVHPQPVTVTVPGRGTFIKQPDGTWWRHDGNGPYGYLAGELLDLVVELGGANQ
jgi:hypothetical protein